MRRSVRYTTVLVAGIVLGALPVGARPAHATGQCVLMYSHSNSWEDPQNWGGACDGLTPDDRRVPDSTDDVLIPNQTAFLLMVNGSETVKSLTVTGTGVDILGSLTVTNGGSIGGAGVSVDGGTFDINGVFSLTMSSYALSTTSNGGVITVDPGAELHFSGSGQVAPPIVYLQGTGELHNQGLITSDDVGGGVITTGLVNDGVVGSELGTLEVFGAPANSMDPTAGGTGSFQPGNGADICFCGARALPPAGVSGAGTISVGVGFSNWDLGDLVVPPGTTFSPGELDVSAGTAEIDEDVSVPVVRYAAGFRTGTGTVTAEDAMWFSDPTRDSAFMRGPGTDVVGPNATGRFSTDSVTGTGGLSLDEGHTLVNNGTLLWDANDAPGTISLANAVITNNNAMEIDNDAQAVAEKTSGGLIGCCGGFLDNHGTITRDTSLGTAQLNVPTRDSGNIDVKTGTLEIGNWRPGGAASEVVAPGAKLVNDYTTFGDATVTKTGGELLAERDTLHGPALFSPSLVIQNPAYSVVNPFGSIVDAGLHVLGNFTIGGGGFLNVSADPGSDIAGPIDVDGNASLGGIVDVVIPTGLQLHDGDVIPLVHVAPGKTLTGTFSGVVACSETSCGNLAAPPDFVAHYTSTDAYLVVAKKAQSITFAALPNKRLGTAPFTVHATAGSGLPVSLSTTTGAVCHVAGTTVSLVATGTCTIVAKQAGNGQYDPAPAVARSFTVEPRPKPRSGYWMVGADGHIYAFGSAHDFGSASGSASALAVRRDGSGYWIVDRHGKVSAFGHARWFGDQPALAPGEFVSTISATPTGNGYWLFTNEGRAFNYGGAHAFGDLRGVHLAGPIIASVATPTGRGYYMVGSDGGVFSFGDAHFHGSTGGIHLNSPIVGIAPTPDNRGYWLVASDGGVFAFDAPFRGSMGGTHLSEPVNGLVAYGNGYLMVASDGGVFDFSNQPFVGSLGNNPPSAPIIGIAALGT